MSDKGLNFSVFLPRGNESYILFLALFWLQITKATTMLIRKEPRMVSEMMMHFLIEKLIVQFLLMFN